MTSTPLYQKNIYINEDIFMCPFMIPKHKKMVHVYRETCNLNHNNKRSMNRFLIGVLISGR